MRMDWATPATQTSTTTVRPAKLWQMSGKVNTGKIRLDKLRKVKLSMVVKVMTWIVTYGAVWHGRVVQ